MAYQQERGRFNLSMDYPMPPPPRSHSGGDRQQTQQPSPPPPPPYHSIQVNTTFDPTIMQQRGQSMSAGRIRGASLCGNHSPFSAAHQAVPSSPNPITTTPLLPVPIGQTSLITPTANRPFSRRASLSITINSSNNTPPADSHSRQPSVGSQHLTPAPKTSMGDYTGLGHHQVAQNGTFSRSLSNVSTITTPSTNNTQGQPQAEQVKLNINSPTTPYCTTPIRFDLDTDHLELDGPVKPLPSPHNSRKGGFFRNLFSSNDKDKTKDRRNSNPPHYSPHSSPRSVDPSNVQLHALAQPPRAHAPPILTPNRSFHDSHHNGTDNHVILECDEHDSEDESKHAHTLSVHSMFSPPSMFSAQRIRPPPVQLHLPSLNNPIFICPNLSSVTTQPAQQPAPVTPTTVNNPFNFTEHSVDNDCEITVEELGVKFADTGKNLASISFEERKEWAKFRTKVVNEILSTEQSYVDALKLMIKAYHDPYIEGKSFTGLSENKISHLFSTIKAILAIAESFLNELEKYVSRWYPAEVIAPVFIKFHPLFKTYSDYGVQHQQNILPMLAKLSEKANFLSFQEKQMKALHCNDLSSYLIQPCQRVPRYRLLLESLISRTESTSPQAQNLLIALKHINQVALTVNESLRNAQNVQRYVAIQKMFDEPNLVHLWRKTLMDDQRCKITRIWSTTSPLQEEYKKNKQKELVLNYKYKEKKEKKHKFVHSEARLFCFTDCLYLGIVDHSRYTRFLESLNSYTNNNNANLYPCFNQDYSLKFSLQTLSIHDINTIDNDIFVRDYIYSNSIALISPLYGVVLSFGSLSDKRNVLYQLQVAQWDFWQMLLSKRSMTAHYYINGQYTDFRNIITNNTITNSNYIRNTLCCDVCSHRLYKVVKIKNNIFQTTTTSISTAAGATTPPSTLFPGGGLISSSSNLYSCDPSPRSLVAGSMLDNGLSQSPHEDKLINDESTIDKVATYSDTLFNAEDSEILIYIPYYLHTICIACNALICTNCLYHDDHIKLKQDGDNNNSSEDWNIQDNGDLPSLNERYDQHNGLEPPTPLPPPKEKKKKKFDPSIYQTTPTKPLLLTYNLLNIIKTSYQPLTTQFIQYLVETSGLAVFHFDTNHQTVPKKGEPQYTPQQSAILENYIKNYRAIVQKEQGNNPNGYLLQYSMTTPRSRSGSSVPDSTVNSQPSKHPFMFSFGALASPPVMANSSPGIITSPSIVSTSPTSSDGVDPQYTIEQQQLLVKSYEPKTRIICVNDDIHSFSQQFNGAMTVHKSSGFGATLAQGRCCYLCYGRSQDELETPKKYGKEKNKKDDGDDEDHRADESDSSTKQRNMLLNIHNYIASNVILDEVNIFIHYISQKNHNTSTITQSQAQFVAHGTGKVKIHTGLSQHATSQLSPRNAAPTVSPTIIDTSIHSTAASYANQRLQYHARIQKLQQHLTTDTRFIPPPPPESSDNEDLVGGNDYEIYYNGQALGEMIKRQQAEQAQKNLMNVVTERITPVKQPQPVVPPVQKTQQQIFFPPLIGSLPEPSNVPPPPLTLSNVSSPPTPPTPSYVPPPPPELSNLRLPPPEPSNVLPPPPAPSYVPPPPPEPSNVPPPPPAPSRLDNIRLPSPEPSNVPPPPPAPSYVPPPPPELSNLRLPPHEPSNVPPPPPELSNLRLPSPEPSNVLPPPPAPSYVPPPPPGPLNNFLPLPLSPRFPPPDIPQTSNPLPLEPVTSSRFINRRVSVLKIDLSKPLAPKSPQQLNDLKTYAPNHRSPAARNSNDNGAASFYTTSVVGNNINHSSNSMSLEIQLEQLADAHPRLHQQPFPLAASSLPQESSQSRVKTLNCTQCDSDITYAKYFVHDRDNFCASCILYIKGYACVFCKNPLSQGLKLGTHHFAHLECVFCVTCEQRPSKMELYRLASGDPPTFHAGTYHMYEDLSQQENPDKAYRYQFYCNIHFDDKMRKNQSQKYPQSPQQQLKQPKQQPDESRPQNDPTLIFRPPARRYQ